MSLGRVGGADDRRPCGQRVAARRRSAVPTFARLAARSGWARFSRQANRTTARRRRSGSGDSCGGRAIQHSPLRLRSIAADAPGDLVLDCVIVEPDEWWVGWHEAESVTSCWPGGRFDVPLPPDAVSRAWLKMEEALAWSGLPIAPGDLCAEIGSAPGGASQALLGHGVHVIGIDPADMDPRVLAHSSFAHWKKRGADVRRREFRKVRWLMADLNVAPAYTLDTVEAIVTHADVSVQGMILTLKLLEWSLAAEIPAYLDRIRSWGFGRVAARQLHHNRQEICVSAQRGRYRSGTA